MVRSSVSQTSRGIGFAKTSGNTALLRALSPLEQSETVILPDIGLERLVAEKTQQKRDFEVKQNSEVESIPSFGRILVATDFSSASESAFRTALQVCNLVHGGLVVLHVFEHSDVAVPESGGSLLEMQALREKYALSLEQLREQAAAAGIACETLLLDGMAPLSILRALDEHDIDLAIIGTNAPHGFERLVFGSTAESVLRKATCPVLTVGPRVTRAAAQVNTGPVVFATDFDYTTMQAIRYAAFFSDQISAPLHCVNVLPRTLEAGAQTEIVPQIMSEALHQLANESGVLIQPPTCATTFGSEVSYAVVEYARQQSARLIVLGVRQASLLASDVPEHITYRIITEANCPVLTMAYGSATPAIQNSRRGSRQVPAENNTV